MEKLPKATATFNNEGTEVTIAIEGKEGAKTFTTKLGALNYGSTLLEAGTVDAGSIWAFRGQILDAKNLKDATTEDKINALNMIGQTRRNQIIITVIEMADGDGGQLSDEEEVPPVMERPVFRICEKCGRHGRFEDEAGTVESDEIMSKQSGFKWIKNAKRDGVIKPEDAQRLIAQVNAAEKIEEKIDPMLEFLLREFLE